MAIENIVGPDIAVYGDASLIQMVVNNLLGNAIKYGEEKSVIRINALHLDAKVAVEVYNDGRPLTVDQQQKLFKRFSRLDSPEGKRVRGTGLGLFFMQGDRGGARRERPLRAAGKRKRFFVYNCDTTVIIDQGEKAWNKPRVNAQAMSAKRKCCAASMTLSRDTKGNRAR
jgi:hypothetical protein